MPQKIIIDADPGIGDALAIALALLDPDLDLLAVTATAGAVSGPTASRNLQAIVDALDPPKWPRLGASALPLPPAVKTSSSESVAAPEIDGPHGLGAFEFEVAELHHRHDAAKVLVDVVRAAPHAVTLITLGPLTNVAMAGELAPDFLSLLKGLVCLGGSVAAGGNVTPAAEFNIFANPEAARSVLRFPATKTLVPLDASSKVVLTFKEFDRLTLPETLPLGRFLSRVCPFALRAHHQHRGLEGIRLHEIAAVAYVAQPQLFETQPAAIDVETRGELTRGATVFDRRGLNQWQSNIDIVSTVEVRGVLDHLARIFQRVR